MNNQNNNNTSDDEKKSTTTTSSNSNSSSSNKKLSSVTEKVEQWFQKVVVPGSSGGGLLLHHRKAKQQQEQNANTAATTASPTFVPDDLEGGQIKNEQHGGRTTPPTTTNSSSSRNRTLEESSWSSFKHSPSWGTILTSDVTLSFGIALVLTIIACFFVPPLTVVALLLCFVLGYSIGRWQVHNAWIWETHVAQQAQLDHREALRPVIDPKDQTKMTTSTLTTTRKINGFRQHTILQQVLGRSTMKQLLHPSPRLPPRSHQYQPLRKILRKGWHTIGSTITSIKTTSTKAAEESGPEKESSSLIAMEEGQDKEGYGGTETIPQPPLPTTTATATTATRQFGRISLHPPTVANSKLPAAMLTTSPLAVALQGMDIFVTDTAVEGVGGHPAFIAAGLRDRPMLILNALTHVGNVLFYFELPAWVKDWDGERTTKTSTSTDNDDDDDASRMALKSFLSASGDVRNARFQMAASLNKGPLVVQTLAPGDATVFGVVGSVNPGTWHYYPGTMTTTTTTIINSTASQDGHNDKGLCPAWELQVDLVDSKFMRTGVSIAKRHLHSLVLDICLLVTPDEQTVTERAQNVEPAAVLSSFRLDHVDMQNAPEFPIPPTPEEDLKRMRRASQAAINVSSLTWDDIGAEQGTEVILGKESV